MNTKFKYETFESIEKSKSAKLTFLGIFIVIAIIAITYVSMHLQLYAR